MKIKKILYTGLKPPTRDDVQIIHCPLIEVIPRPPHSEDIVQALDELHKTSHIIMTSKTAVRYFFDLCPAISEQALFLSVGKATTVALQQRGCARIQTACDESQEGVISLIREVQDPAAFFFLGHSSLSRPTLIDFLTETERAFLSCVLYETRLKPPHTHSVYRTLMRYSSQALLPLLHSVPFLEVFPKGFPCVRKALSLSKQLTTHLTHRTGGEPNESFESEFI